MPLAEAIDSALSTITAEAALRGVSVERGPIDNLVVMGSRYRLEQALVNLLANAVKFNRDDGKVRVETQRNGTTIGILVSDTGVGIPSAICREFSSASTAWTRRGRARWAAQDWVCPS